MDTSVWNQCMEPFLSSVPSQEAIDHAQQTMISMSQQPGFVAFLLQYIQTCSNPSAVLFTLTQVKNNLSRYWENDELYTNSDGSSQKEGIKEILLQLLINSEGQIESLCAVCISYIARSDYPQKWPNLMTFFTRPFNSETFDTPPQVMYAILDATSQVLKPAEIDNPFKEINRSSSPWEQPTLLLLNEILPSYMSSAGGLSPSIAKMFVFTLQILCTISYSELSGFVYQHLPEYVNSFINLLHSNNVDIIIELCNLLKIYISRFTREILNWGTPESSCPKPENEMDQVTAFHQLWENLLRSLIELVGSVGAAPEDVINSDDKEKYIVAVFQPLTALMRSSSKNFFMQDGMLQTLFINIIIPSIALTPDEIDIFENEPYQFYQKETQGESLQSKRKVAYNFLKLLCRYFRDALIEHSYEFYKTNFAAYQSNPTENWVNMDAAIFILGSTLVSKQTLSDNVIEVHEQSIGILKDFVQSFIIPKFDPNEPFKILQADAIKFLIDFRNVLPPELIDGAFRELPQLLNSPSITIRFFVANCINKLMSIHSRVSDFQVNSAYLSTLDLSGLTQTLYNSLTYKLGDKTQMNEPAARCLMKLIATAGPIMSQFVPSILSNIIPIITALIHTPNNAENPDFAHCLFEIIAAILSCVQYPVANVQSQLLPILLQVLQGDVSEYVPYVFQLLSVFLISSDPSSIDPFYVEKFGDLLLNPDLWRPFGNVPALAMLVRAYCIKLPQLIIENAGTMFEICHILLPKTLSHMHAFTILLSMVHYLNPDFVLSQIQNILALVTAEPNSNAVKFQQNFAVFMSNVAFILGPDNFIPQCSPEIIQKWGESLPYVRQRNNLEDALGGMIATLCKSSILHGEPWEILFEGTVKMMECTSKDFLNEEMKVMEEEKENAQQFDTTFNELIYGKPPGSRLHEELSNVDLLKYMAESFANWSQSHPGVLAHAVSQRLPANLQSAFNNYQKYYQITFS